MIIYEVLQWRFATFKFPAVPQFYAVMAFSVSQAWFVPSLFSPSLANLTLLFS
jgi:hypothetical protein